MMTPLSDIVRTVISPPITFYRQLRVIVDHSLKRATRGGQHIRLAAEILDYSFTSAVEDRDHVKGTPQLLFIAVEPQLSERQVCSQLVHSAFSDSHSLIVIVADPAVSLLSGPARWRSVSVDRVH